MSRTLTPPIASVPIGRIQIDGKTVDVQQHPEFVRFFFDLFSRVGGVSGASSEDLSLSQFEDAGIEEIRSLMFSTRDAAAQTPEPQQHIQDNAIDGDLASLREAIAQLQTAVQALQQGATA